MTSKRFRFLLPAMMLGGLLMASCSSVDRKTQITVALLSETEVPAELDTFSVRVLALRTGEPRFNNTYYPKSGREFPTTLAIIPVDEDSIGSPLRIEIEGRKNGELFLKRESVLSYFEGRNVLLTMPLRMACFKFKDCGPKATCAGGECVPVDTDPGNLPDFEPQYVFAKEGACFDEQACLEQSTEVSVSAEDCSFELPEGDSNVAIRWEAARDRLLALDAEDSQEGWTRIASNRGRLSQGACDSHFKKTGPDGKPLVFDWAEKVYVSTKCAAKTARLPSCFSVKTQHAGVGALVPLQSSGK